MNVFEVYQYKTSVGSVKLGKALDFSTRLSYSRNVLPLIDRVKGGVPNFIDHLIFVSKPYTPNLRHIGPFLHVEKFVVVGGWWWWVLKVDFSVKLEAQA